VATKAAKKGKKLGRVKKLEATKTLHVHGKTNW
jgi:hypothetical protein